MKGTEQKKVIRKMYKVELIISQMYIVFSDHFPEYASFWKQMAAEQAKHADLVKLLCKAEVQGTLKYNDDEVKEKTLETFILFIERIIRKAQHNKITAETAVALAMEIESSLIVKEVYKGFTVIDSNCRYIPGKLFHGTLGHLEKASQMLARFSDNFKQRQLMATPPMEAVCPVHI